MCVIQPCQQAERIVIQARHKSKYDRKHVLKYVSVIIFSFRQSRKDTFMCALIIGPNGIVKNRTSEMPSVVSWLVLDIFFCNARHMQNSAFELLNINNCFYIKYF